MKGCGLLLGIIALALVGGAVVLAILQGLVGAGAGGVAALIVIGLIVLPFLLVPYAAVRDRLDRARKHDGSAWDALRGIDCPHCGRRAMSMPAKWALGGSGIAPCRRCGLRVMNASFPLVLLLAPPLAALLMLGVWFGIAGTDDMPLVTLVFLACGCALSLSMAATVRFVRGEPTDEDAVGRARDR